MSACLKIHVKIYHKFALQIICYVSHVFLCEKHVGTKYYFLFKGWPALTSPIAREWLSTMALPASPSSSVGQPLSPRHDTPQVDSPQEEREQVGEDLLEFADDNEEDFKEYKRW